MITKKLEMVEVELLQGHKYLQNGPMSVYLNTIY